jgi:hypothetical protein
MSMEGRRLHSETARQRGQSVIEYMLVTSVVAIAIWASAQLFVPQWRSGLSEAVRDVADGVWQGFSGGGGNEEP